MNWSLLCEEFKNPGSREWPSNHYYYRFGCLSPTRLSRIPCSRKALSPANTRLNPPVESRTWETISSDVPSNPLFRMVTKVAASPIFSKVQVALFPSPGPNSNTIRLLGSSSSTLTGIFKSYISQVHVTDSPSISGPVLCVNQNLVVIFGSTKAL